jgi:signal transduction histidine kinase
MSLKGKMSLFAGGLVAVVVTSFAAALYWAEQKALLRGQREQTLRSVQALAQVCREPAIGGPGLGLTNYLKKAKESPEVVEAWCVDVDGVILGHTDLLKLRDRTPPDRLAQALAAAEPVLEDRGDVLEASAAVQLSSRRAGTAFLVESKAVLRRRFEEALADTRRRLVPLILGALAAGFAGAFALTALAVKPLQDLVEGVRTIASGRWDHRVLPRRADEVGWLAGEFNQMAEKLGELDRLKQDFVSGVTHDLKSPLAAVKVAVDSLQGEADAVEKGKADPKAMAESLFTIRRSMERLTQMITSLLEVAHIEQGLSLTKTPGTLDDVADRVVNSFELIARQKGLSLRLVVESTLAPVPMDAPKVERALANLVSNAVKYTDAGGIVVTVGERDGRQEARVSDTGAGLSKASLEKLFTKFFRADAPGRKAEGTGLGLTIVRGIARAHGGDVSVESEIGKGSTFTLWLPKP